MPNYNKNDIFWRKFASLPENIYLANVDLVGLRILLIYPTVDRDISKNDYPISLGYMASILRMNNAEVDIFIQNLNDYNHELFSGYDMICIYPMAFLLDQTLKYSKKIKDDYPLSKICYFNSEQHQHEMLLCTPLAKDFARAIMEQSVFIDYILIGEAEMTLVRLCEKLAKRDNNYADVASCLYREGREIRFSQRPSESVDFDYLPFPSRDYLEESISADGINLFSPRVQSSRGCVSRCSYCVESNANLPRNMKRKAWLSRDLGMFIDEIEMLSRDYGVIFFNVIDSSFEDPGMVGIERMKRFFEEVLSRGIQASFKIHLRIETIDKLNDNDLQTMKNAGVDILVLGVESGVERELRSFNKRTTVEKSLKNVCRLDDYDKFFSLLGHMMFSACLRLDDLPNKAKFLKSIHRGWDYLNMSNNVLVFRGTVYHDYINKMGLALTTDNLSAVIPYRFEDKRVKYVADEMGYLKNRCPEVIMLNNLLYDAQNVASRFFNVINKHLWEHEKSFRRFREGLSQILFNVEGLLLNYFLELVDLASSGWSISKANLIYQRWIQSGIPGNLIKTTKLVDDFFGTIKNSELSVEKLYLKTWMSLINTEANTASGKVGVK